MSSNRYRSQWLWDRLFTDSTKTQSQSYLSKKATLDIIPSHSIPLRLSVVFIHYQLVARRSEWITSSIRPSIHSGIAILGTAAPAHRLTPHLSRAV
jgi:hypothetical protein